MTFEQFQTTGRDTTDLGAELSDEGLAGRQGRIYHGLLFIEDASAWTSDAPGYGKGKWSTRIGRVEYQSDDIAAIERHIYDFAVSEEIA